MSGYIDYSLGALIAVRAANFRLNIEGPEDLLTESRPRIVFICGPQDSMKSTLAFTSVCRNWVESGMRSLYLVLDEWRMNLLRQMKALGAEEIDYDGVLVLDLPALERNMPHEESEGWLSSFKAYVQKTMEEQYLDILAIDPIDVLEATVASRDSHCDLENLLEWIRTLKKVCVIVLETPDGILLPWLDSFGQMHGDEILRIDLAPTRSPDRKQKEILMRIKRRGDTASLFRLVFKEGKFRALS